MVGVNINKVMELWILSFFLVQIKFEKKKEKKFDVYSQEPPYYTSNTLHISTGISNLPFYVSRLKLEKYEQNTSLISVRIINLYW